MARTSAWSLTSLVVAFIGCTHAELPVESDGAVAVQSIVVTPEEATLVLVDGQIQQQAFRAYALQEGGKVDVTDQVAWKVQSGTMGRFVGGGLFRTETLQDEVPAAARHGGTTRVVAELDGAAGAAELTVIFRQTVRDSGTPVDAASKFSGKVAASRAPKLIYPRTGLLVPPNLGQLELQWTKSSNDLFQVRITSETLDLRIYTAARSYNLAGALWQAVAWGNREAGVKVVVQGTSAKQPTVRGVSAPSVINVARDDVKGGLYYWVASKVGGIYRYNFDKPADKAEPYYTAWHAGDCVGCHAVSRGGKRVAFTKSGGNGNTAILDAERRTPVIDSKYRGNIQTFSPAGDEVIVAYMGQLTRRAVASGAVEETLATGPGKASHPDWSPDGSMLTYVAIAAKDYVDDVHFKNGSVAVMTRSGSGGWSAPKVLVQGGKGVNYYYPTFSPQGDWILFNRSTGDSYSDADANLYIVKPSGGKPIALSRLNGAQLSNSWPRWSPFIQKYGETTIYWLTFSSVRNYGVKLLNSAAKSYADKAPQIWMAAFDLELAAAGQDPSTYPFWLPFQDTTHHNHIAQWTEKVIAIK